MLTKRTTMSYCFATNINIHYKYSCLRLEGKGKPLYKHVSREIQIFLCLSKGRNIFKTLITSMFDSISDGHHYLGI